MLEGAKPTLNYVIGAAHVAADAREPHRSAHICPAHFPQLVFALDTFPDLSYVTFQLR
jgi:hypothetical protein